jgi:hypothetical protein
MGLNHAPDSLARFAVTGIRNRTRIYNNDIRLFGRLNNLIPGLSKKLSQSFALSLINFAAKRDETNGGNLMSKRFAVRSPPFKFG